MRARGAQRRIRPPAAGPRWSQGTKGWKEDVWKKAVFLVSWEGYGANGVGDKWPRPLGLLCVTLVLPMGKGLVVVATRVMAQRTRPPKRAALVGAWDGLGRWNGGGLVPLGGSHHCSSIDSVSSPMVMLTPVGSRVSW